MTSLSASPPKSDAEIGQQHRTIGRRKPDDRTPKSDAEIGRSDRLRTWSRPARSASLALPDCHARLVHRDGAAPFEPRRIAGDLGFDVGDDEFRELRRNLPGRCQPDFEPASVERVLAALDQRVALEPVKDARYGRSVQPNAPANLPRGAARVVENRVEDQSFRGVEPVFASRKLQASCCCVMSAMDSSDDSGVRGRRPFGRPSVV